MIARLFTTLVVVAAVLASPLAPVGASRLPEPSSAPVPPSDASILFIENVGQFADGARFLVRGSAQGDVWLAEDGIWLSVVEPPVRPPSSGSRNKFDVPVASARQGRVNLKVSFVGANAHPRMEPFGRSSTHVSYFLGNDPREWRSDVPVWSGVRYADLYPGLDLELRGEGGDFDWRIVARDADAYPAASIRLEVEGADSVAVEGGLIKLTTSAGAVAVPLINAPTDLVPLGHAPAIQGRQIISPLLSVDRANPTPTLPAGEEDWGGMRGLAAGTGASNLIYATFLGGGCDDYTTSVALDATGSAYLAGYTCSPELPAVSGPGPDPTYNGGYDAYVLKLDPNGTGLLYATFLGGADDDYAYGIAVDDQGRAFVAGQTASSDFPAAISPGFDGYYNGGTDGFVASLTSDGLMLAYATFLGGHGYDSVHAIAVNGLGYAFVTGQTYSVDFPITFGRSYDTTQSLGDAFAVRLGPTGDSLAYATFLGGSDVDAGNAIAVDEWNNAYVVGNTQSADLVPGGIATYDGIYGGTQDAFVAKINASGTSLVYITYLGGIEQDWGYGVAVDHDGNAYVTGYTMSVDFPAVYGPGYDTAMASGGDGFLLKLNAQGTAPEYATFIGGRGSAIGTAVAVDEDGGAYVAGGTSSPLFTTSPGALDTTYNSSPDGVFLKISADGMGLVYSTFVGGGRDDDAFGLAVDAVGRAYVAGRTLSPDSPAALGPGYDMTYNGLSDGFLIKLTTDPPEHSLFFPLLGR